MLSWYAGMKCNERAERLLDDASGSNNHDGKRAIKKTISERLLVDNTRTDQSRTKNDGFLI